MRTKESAPTTAEGILEMAASPEGTSAKLEPIDGASAARAVGVWSSSSSHSKSASATTRLQPGMPVDVIIKKGERTFMSYLLKPLTDKVAPAFKD
jgi:multidrug efflux pump subunit AcrA (membrane-fusion protein)